MNPIHTTPPPTDLAASNLAPVHDPLTAVAPQGPGSADDPRASIEYWYFCGEGAMGAGINTYG